MVGKDGRQNGSSGANPVGGNGPASNVVLWGRDMLVSEYDLFVQKTDRSSDKPHEERLDIAIFGLAAEIGSVIAAIKKRLLASDAATSWNVANDEIVAELGDVVWYCFALARIANESRPTNIFVHDIVKLQREIGGDGERAAQLRRVLDPNKRSAFLEAAQTFPRHTRDMRFENYQDIAFLTARTSDRELVEVCLSVLSQLNAELFRHQLPAVEQELNTNIKLRPINDVLGEIAWHIAALASSYQLSLGYIAEKNMEKVSQRYDRSVPTPLHDGRFPEDERFPRQFEVAVVSVGPKRSRMYFKGWRLGDDLTNNAYQDDGYRFHDIMHLANVAKLGWSPVLRGLMKLKRKSKPKVDEVEDGARAKIVEEAIIKAIHSEGVRLATLRTPGPDQAKQQLFLNASEISNHFLDFVHNFVTGLEVEKNQLWEWEDAIVEGYEIFHRLRQEGQGTISVDLTQRKITFRAEVGIDIAGRVAGMGAAVAEAAAERQNALRCAIIQALGLIPDTVKARHCGIVELGGGLVSVKASGPVQQAMWDHKVIAFRTTVVPDGERIWCCALAMADNEPLD